LAWEGRQGDSFFPSFQLNMLKFGIRYLITMEL